MGGAEGARSEALEHLRYATAYDADAVLQETVDAVREVFGADLCIVHLMIPDGMYFRAWSGPLPEEFVESKIIPNEMSMCPPVVEGAAPIVVEDLSESEGYRSHFVCRVGGMRFYAGTPLVTSEGTAIGTLCLMDHLPKRFTGDELKTLQAFGRAVVGRLETLGALGRERAAREEEARRGRELRRVLDSSKDIITTVGFDGVFRTMNRACTAVVGYEPEELIGRAHVDLVHPADRPRAREAAGALARGEPVVGCQVRYLRKDGGAAWVEWNATALPEEGVFYCVARDVSARKRAEEELRNQLDLTAATMSSLGEGVYTVDAEGRLTSLNPAAERMLGWSEGELLGENMHDAVHHRRADGAPLPSEECALLDVIRSGRVYRDDGDSFVRRDGTSFPVSYTSSPIRRDGEIAGAVVAFGDDTNRRRAEEDLRRQMDLYETLLEAQSAVGEGLVIAEGSRVVYANEAFSRISGYGPEELEGMPSLFELIPKERRRDAREKLLERLSGERSEGHLETVLLHKGGRRVDLELGVRLLRGEVPRLIVVARDISERKDAERRLQAQFAVTCALEEAQTLDEASPGILRAICENLGWAVGGLWEVDRPAEKLRCVRVWQAPADCGLEGFAEGSRRVALARGEGLPGRAWEGGEPLWIPDVVRDANFSRAALAERAGLHGAVAVPILLRGEVLGVMEFFGRERRDPDGAVLETIGAIGIQMGQFIERREAEETLRLSEERFRGTFEQAAVGVAHVGIDGRWIRVNRKLSEILGYRREELLGETFGSFTHPDDLGEDFEQLRSLLDGEAETYSREKRYLRKDGDVVWVNLTVSLLRGPSGEPEYFISVVEDVTGRKLTEEALRRAEEKYRGIFENAVEGIFQASTDWRLLTVNPAMARIYGYDSPGEMMEDYSHAGRLYGDRESRAELERSVQEHGSVANFEVRVYRRDGGWIWVSANARALRGADGDLLGYEGTIEDITERKALEERLEHQAFHDGLTGLPNRALFLDRLEHALARARRGEGADGTGGLVALLFVDLDGFKNVNDSLGHAAGDDLLIQAARRLAECVRPGDTVARLGGDEFTVLLEGVSGSGEALVVAERISGRFDAPFAVGGRDVFLTASIGVVVGGPEKGPEELLRASDIAMYEAKKGGKARHEVFEEGMNRRVARRFELEADLRRAVEAGEIEVHYQPIVWLNSGLTHELEALVRWRRPDGSLVPPADFIPLAEETGLILPVGRHVLREALGAVRALNSERGENGEPLKLSVNLSAKQFADPGLVGDVARTLRETGFDPRHLRLEITESLMMENAASTVDALKKLKALGVEIAVDDFGTGYSSLSYLKRFPVDYLKIDRSFVDGLGRDPEDEGIVGAIVAVAGSLGLGVVAEGIETEGQLEKLRSLGCNRGQGYHFARPLPVGELGPALLSERP